MKKIILWGGIALGVAILAGCWVNKREKRSASLFVTTNELTIVREKISADIHALEETVTSVRTNVEYFSSLGARTDELEKNQGVILSALSNQSALIGVLNSNQLSVCNSVSNLTVYTAGIFKMVVEGASTQKTATTPMAPCASVLTSTNMEAAALPESKKTQKVKITGTGTLKGKVVPIILQQQGGGDLRQDIEIEFRGDEVRTNLSTPAVGATGPARSNSRHDPPFHPPTPSVVEVDWPPFLVGYSYPVLVGVRVGNSSHPYFARPHTCNSRCRHYGQ
ncbi:MAG: hypothetical protein ABI430_05155 [Candidatus Taylorbacteria bacterium]